MMRGSAQQPSKFAAGAEYADGRLRRPAFVPMMESTDLGEFHHLPNPRSLNISCLRRVLVQRKMGS